MADPRKPTRPVRSASPRNCAKRRGSCPTGANGDPMTSWGPLITFHRSASIGAASLVRHGRSYNLGIEFDAYGPQGAHGFRRNPIHLMTLDGGDREMVERLGGWGRETEEQISMIWRSPMRFNDDFIIMPLQCATQWDALSHVYYDQQLYNGYSADTCTSLGASKDGIDKVARAGQVVGRGVLLDIAHLKGESQLGAGAVVTPDDLDAAAEAERVEIREGDIIMVRTGWRQEFLRTREGETWAMTSPGLSWHCARWLAAHHCAAVGLRQHRGGDQHRRVGGDLAADAHAGVARYGNDAR